MKSMMTKGLVIALLSTSVSAYALTRSQHDTAVGAVLGGVAGAVAGNDITSTVAGAALGGVVGSQWNAHKTERARPSDDHRPDRPKMHHHEEHRPERHGPREAPRPGPGGDHHHDAPPKHPKHHD